MRSLAEDAPSIGHPAMEKRNRGPPSGSRDKPNRNTSDPKLIPRKRGLIDANDAHSTDHLALEKRRYDPNGGGHDNPNRNPSDPRLTPRRRGLVDVNDFDVVLDKRVKNGALKNGPVLPGDRSHDPARRQVHDDSVARSLQKRWQGDGAALMTRAIPQESDRHETDRRQVIDQQSNPSLDKRSQGSPLLLQSRSFWPTKGPPTPTSSPTQSSHKPKKRHVIAQQSSTFLEEKRSDSSPLDHEFSKRLSGGTAGDAKPPYLYRSKRQRSESGPGLQRLPRGLDQAGRLSQRRDRDIDERNGLDLESRHWSVADEAGGNAVLQQRSAKGLVLPAGLMPRSQQMSAYRRGWDMQHAPHQARADRSETFTPPSGNKPPPRPSGRIPAARDLDGLAERRDLDGVTDHQVERRTSKNKAPRVRITGRSLSTLDPKHVPRSLKPGKGSEDHPKNKIVHRSLILNKASKDHPKNKIVHRSVSTATSVALVKRNGFDSPLNHRDGIHARAVQQRSQIVGRENKDSMPSVWERHWTVGAPDSTGPLKRDSLGTDDDASRGTVARRHSDDGASADEDIYARFGSTPNPINSVKP